jgi:Amt family ammonium transporter
VITKETIRVWLNAAGFCLLAVLAMTGFAFAQEAAPAAADAAAAAAPKLDSGDTAWMLTSTAIVLMMTIPGLALFYGGMVRKKNVLATLMQSFAITCLVTVFWFVIGYTLAFTEGGPFVGGLSRVLLMGMDPKAINTLAPTIPETVYCMYQLTFAIITCALLTGSIADRLKFSALCVFIPVWLIVVYCPIAHTVWMANDGLLAKMGVLDFAGGTVVHINSGIAGLVACLVMGKRKGYGTVSMAPDNLVLSVIGASLLWVGWFGFNAGSAVSAGTGAGMAMLATQIATAGAALAWMFVEWAVKGKPSVLGIISGAVAGLVAITPASGYVGPGAALLIGIAGGAICFWTATVLKNLLGYDDSLDAFGVHGIGGTVGALLTGVFASQAIGGDSSIGALEGNMGQLLLQAEGVALTIVWSGVMTLVLLKIVDLIIGLRVDEEIEREGLDLGLHGETVH